MFSFMSCAEQCSSKCTVLPDRQNVVCASDRRRRQQNTSANSEDASLLNLDLSTPQCSSLELLNSRVPSMQLPMSQPPPLGFSYQVCIGISLKVSAVHHPGGEYKCKSTQLFVWAPLVTGLPLLQGLLAPDVALGIPIGVQGGVQSAAMPVMMSSIQAPASASMVRLFH